MTTKSSVLKAIRLKCIDCCVGQTNEVRHCTSMTCDLWPFRLGMDPSPSKPRGVANHASRGKVLSKERGSESCPLSETFPKRVMEGMPDG